MPNILDSPPQPIQGLVLIDGHAMEQTIVSGTVLLDEDDTMVNTPLLLTMVSENEPLFIANPDILLPPRASTPYPVYPGTSKDWNPPPTSVYRKCLQEKLFPPFS